MSATIVTRAPTRIDFGGGWTDVPPYSDEKGGYVCNVAITRYATVTVTRGGGQPPAVQSRDADRSITDAAARRFHVNDASISVESDFPIGAGLGGSSAAGVATVAALAIARGQPMTPSAIAELSRAIEIGDLGIAGGRQDHYAAAFGGALGLRFSARGTEVHEIPLGAKIRAAIEHQCFIVYTGQSRFSADNVTAVMDAYRKRDPGVLAALDAMRRLAESMAHALTANDINALAKLVGQQWTHQRSLHPAIPTPAIDEMIARATESGAIGAKALGASGGGCVLVIARADRLDEVRAVVESMGEVLPFSIARDGVEQCR